MELGVCYCSSAGLFSVSTLLPLMTPHRTFVTPFGVFNFGLFAVGFKARGKEKRGQAVRLESTARMYWH